MIPLRLTDLHGHGRTPAVLLVIEERDALLRIAAKRFCVGMSDREAAKHLYGALNRYRGGRWRRDRADLTCPAQHRGKLTELLYFLLRTRDSVPSIMTIRRALGTREPRDMVRFAF
jgi:hypothetical protein